MTQYYTVMTTIGIQKLAAAQAGGPRVHISEMAVGDSRREPSPEYTALENEKWRGPINQLKVDSANPHWIIAETHVPADVGGWMVREIGLFDMDGDLIVIGRQPDTYKPKLNEGTAKELVIKMIAEVSNSELVELTIDPSVVMASREYVDNKYDETVKNLEERMDAFQLEVNEKIDSLTSITNVLSNGLQRVMILLELDGKTQGGYGFFDDFDGTPKAMKVLNQSIVLKEELVEGIDVIPHDGVLFDVGEEVTIAGTESYETLVIKSVDETNITFTDKTINSYPIGSIISPTTRSKSISVSNITSKEID